MALSLTRTVAAAAILLGVSSAAFGFSTMSGNSNVKAPKHECDAQTSDEESNLLSRRSLLMSTVAATFVSTVLTAEASYAATDCFSDCLKNCKLIAPKDPQYCTSQCEDYCAQDDRTDGLSGSTSSSGGEMGILGTSTVVKGEDKPPQVRIPGLDFTSDKGKKLIGY